MSKTRNGKSDFGILSKKSQKSEPRRCQVRFDLKKLNLWKMSKTRNSKSDLGSLSKKIQTHEKVKVSEIAGGFRSVATTVWSVSQEVNSGGQRKKKVKQKISLVYYKRQLSDK